MTKKSRQKFKYLENEKSFKDEISIFQHFWRAIIKAKKQKKSFESKSLTLAYIVGSS